MSKVEGFINSPRSTSIKTGTQLRQVKHLQDLYDSGTLKSDEGFHHITNIMKPLLMKYLINRSPGYYKNGEKQSNFGDEELRDCYIYVLDRVYGTYTYKKGKPGRVKYGITRNKIYGYFYKKVKGKSIRYNIIRRRKKKPMSLASFIHTWTRGFASDLTKKQQRRYKSNFHKSLYLEDIFEGSSKTPEKFQKHFDETSIDLAFDLDVEARIPRLHNTLKGVQNGLTSPSPIIKFLSGEIGEFMFKKELLKYVLY